ncbi:MAG: hypothetical protein ACRDRS_11525 [Pseudonocardiaceae bacterium]
MPGSGAVPGLVEHGGQGGVVQAGTDAAGEFDRHGVGGAQLPGPRSAVGAAGKTPSIEGLSVATLVCSLS